MKKHLFIPATKEINVTRKIVYRPIKSWHSATFAGEKLEKLPGTNDGSGCMKRAKLYGELDWDMTYIPKTVTHRLYWHKDNPKETMSAFLSYPDGMGSCNEYFWEAYPIKGDVERWTGDKAEEDMEKVLVRILNRKAKKRGK